MTNKSENPREKLYRKVLHSHWVKIVSALASVVVFCTAYALILPAITMSNQDPKCGIEEHTHIAECYDAEGNIICGLEEHAHSLSCYSDLYAAIEDEGYWSADIPELTGDRNADVLAVAQSQIGYRENDENYLVSENEQTKGYTRYGHWYGEFVDTESERLENGLSYYAYKDWDAMFASFVLYNADIYDMGLDSDAGNWAGALGEAGIYVDAADYVPQIGDLIFYTRNAGENMHVGIVSGVNRGFFGNEIKSISVIAGDSNNEVEEIKVAVAEYTEGDITFETIHGYGVLTPGYGVTDESTASEVQPDDSTVAEVAAEEIAGEDVAVEPAVEEAADASEAEEVVNLDNSADHLIGQNEESLDTVEENVEGSALVEIVDGAVSEDGSEIVMNWSLSANLPDATLPAGAIIRVDTASAKVHSMTVEQARAWAETAGTGAEYATFVDNDNYEITFIGDNGLLYSWADVQNMDAAAATSFTGIHVKAVNDVALGEDGAISFNFATTAKVADANVGQNYYVSKVNVNGCAGAATFTYENGEAEAVDQNEVLRDAGLEEEPAQKTLVSKKSDYTVTMSYGPEAEIPDGSKLYVKEIRKGTKEYDQYIEDAKVALGINEEDTAELLGRFFDIKIITKEGEFEPKAPVNVNIEYQKAIVTEDASYVNAVHFSEDGTEAIPVETVDISKPENEMAEVKSVEFSAESFSVYGVVYTVDFEYTNPATNKTYYFSIDGGTSIYLSELLVVLGVKTEEESKQFVTDEVADVQFSNNELIDVRREDNGDWTLESLQAFDTEESLTISLKNGEIIEVKVTDAADQTTNLNELVQGFAVSGAVENPDGSYTVKPGMEYSVNLWFQESDATKQFSDNQEMVYTLPEGVTLKDITSPFDIPVNDMGINYVIHGNTVRVEGNRVYVKFNNGDDNFAHLASITTTRIDLQGKVIFARKEGVNHYDVPGGGTFNIDSTADVDIEKEGKLVNFETGQVQYTLKLTSKGDNDGITVEDKITGTALDFNEDSVVMRDSNNTIINVNPENNPEGNDNGFKLNTGALKNGTYYITYTATLNKGELHDDIWNGNALGISSDTNNTVSWNGRTLEKNLGHIVEVPKSSKGQVGNSVTNNATGMATTTWKIEGDSNYKEDWRLKNVHDSLKTEGVRYSGDGIYITIKDKTTGNLVTPNPVLVRWENFGVNKETATGWTYDVSTLPNYDNQGKYWHYEITYTTEYDATDLEANITIKNEETTNNDPEPDEGEAIVTPTDENRTNIGKTASQITSEYILWEVTLTVPAKGLSAERAVVEEIIPYVQNKYTDSYVTNSFEYVAGHYLPDDGTPSVTDNGDKVIFSWPNGFANSGTGSPRNIVFRFKTLNNTDWLDDENVTDNHKNHILFNGSDTWTDAVPVKPTFKKVGSDVIEQGGELYYDFDVTMNTITESSFANGPIVFTDQFDNTHLQYVDGSAIIYSGDDINNISQTYDSHCKPVVTVSGNTATFTVTRRNLPGKHGEIEPNVWGEVDVIRTFYKLHYRMKVIDKDALQTEAFGKPKLTVAMNNTITGLGETTGTTVEYTPKILDKQKLGVDEHGRIKFQITVNEIKADLEKGDVIELTDHLENLSVHYHDIEIQVEDNYTVETKDASGKPVTVPYFNMSGDDITFYLPDQHKVWITYYAKPVGEVGDDGKIHYKNTASLKGYEKVVEDSETYSGEASGTATNYGVKLYKADGYVNSKLLAGAVFKLYIADEVDEEGRIISGTPMKNRDGSDYTVVTNADGEIDVKGDATTTGWNLRPEQRYYLLEVQAPPGCAIDNTKYQFIISQKGYVNYTGNYVQAPDGSGAIIAPWTFYNGDVVTVKNWPKKGELVLQKTFDGINAQNLDDDQRAAIRFVVYKQIASEPEQYEAVKTVGYNEFTGPTYTIGDLEAGTYKVVEVIDDVNCTQTTYSVTNNNDNADNTDQDRANRYATIVISTEDLQSESANHTVSVTNHYDQPSEFKIYKYANYAAGAQLKDMKLADAEFGVFTFESGQIGQQVGDNYKTNSRGRFSVIPEVNGIQYDTVYCVKEVKAPYGYQVSEQEFYICFSSQGNDQLPNGAPGNTIRIPYKQSHNEDVPDEIGTTSIGVKKIWLDTFLEPSDEIGDPIKVKIKQIASYDKDGTVIEESESGFFPNDTIKFDVVKDGNIWKLHAPEGTTLPSPLSIDQTTGMLTGLPAVKYLATGVPLYYKYEVEEVDVQNYTPTYEYKKDENGNTIAEVTNKPNSVKSTVKLKLKKKWVDSDGNDVTDSMGFNEKVTADVYRVRGIIKAGSIFEDGVKTNKDVNDMFGMTFRIYDGAERATINATSLVCLPGDQIQIKATPLEFMNSKTVEDVELTIKNGNDVLPVDISDGEHYICTIPADQSAGTQIGIYAYDGNLLQFEVEVKNLTADAAGRAIVLTQEEASGIEGATPVQTLTLEKRNGWEAESKELSGGTASTIYSYFIKEPKGGDYDAIYTLSNDTVNITNVDKKLKVDKKWFTADGTTEISNDKGEIVYKLYQIAIPSDYIPYTGGGNISLDYSDLSPIITQLTGNASNGGIKEGSAATIKLITTDQYNGLLTGDIDVTGAHVISDEIAEQKETVDEGTYSWERFISRTRTITVENISEGFSIDGTYANNGAPCTLELMVTGEPSGLTPPTPDHYKDNLVATVTMLKSEVTSSFAESYSDSGIIIKPGNGNFTSLVEKLPAKGPNYETYEYYVEEVSVSNGFEFDSISNLPVESGGTVLIKNKQILGSVEVTKAFKNAPRMPENFKITATYNDGVSEQTKELTISNKDSGNGTESDPYKWVINNVPVGTVVTFIETGYNIDGYKVVINGSATAEAGATVTATADQDEPGQASFINEYSPLTGQLKVTKAAEAGSDATNKEFVFETVLRPRSDIAIDTSKIEVTGGTLISTTPANPSAGNAVTVQLKVTGAATATIKGIPLGTTYTVTEPTNNMPDGWKQTGDVQYSNNEKAISSVDSTDEATITNKKVDFEFFKEWLDEDVIAWPEEGGAKVGITVEVGRRVVNSTTPDPTFKLTYEIAGANIVNGSTVTPNEAETPQLAVSVIPGEGSNPDTYKFSLQDLDYYAEDGSEYEYFVKETVFPEGFKLAYYMKGSTTFEADKDVVTDGIIVNTTVHSYELPSTGGNGTSKYRVAGIMMLVIALAGVILSKRRERWCND